MVPKPKHELARIHLETAQADFSGGREGDALNALFYAAEAAAVALADHHGVDTEKKHWMKSSAMTTLYKEGKLDEDWGPTLAALNQARKDVWYEGEEVEDSIDLEDTLAEIETLVEAALEAKP